MKFKCIEVYAVLSSYFLVSVESVMIFRLAFLLLVICVVSLFFLVHFARGFINFIGIFKELDFALLFFSVFLFSIPLISAQIFINSFSCLLSIHFIFLSSSLSWKLRLLIWYFSYFLMQAWIAINFPTSAALASSHKDSLCVFLFSSRSLYFLCFTWDFLFDPWTTQECGVQFGHVPVIFWLLICSLISLWSESILCKVSIFLVSYYLFNDPRYGLSWYMFHGHLTRIWFLLLLGGVFYKCCLDSVDWWQLNSSTTADFCLIVLSIVEKGGIKSPATITDLLTSFFTSSSFLHILQLRFGGHPHRGLLYLLGRLTLFYCAMFCSVAGNFLQSDVYLSDINIDIVASLWLIFDDILFPTFYF